MKEVISSLIEKRVLEATKKQITNKLYNVAKILGKPIIAQSSGITHSFDDPWNSEEDFLYSPSSIPVVDIDSWDILEKGYYFDGLRCGVNLCITAFSYENKLIEIKATYNGYIVFAEFDSEIKAYAPFPAWENALQMFYEASLEREKKTQQEQKEVRQEKNKKKLASIWENLKKSWGY